MAGSTSRTTAGSSYYYGVGLGGTNRTTTRVPSNRRVVGGEKPRTTQVDSGQRTALPTGGGGNGRVCTSRCSFCAEPPLPIPNQTAVAAGRDSGAEGRASDAAGSAEEQAARQESPVLNKHISLLTKEDGKMIIPVSIDKAAQAAAAQETGDGSSKEGNQGVCVPLWSMVELQGELISKDPLSGQSLGSMTSENVSARFSM